MVEMPQVPYLMPSPGQDLFIYLYKLETKEQKAASSYHSNQS